MEQKNEVVVELSEEELDQISGGAEIFKEDTSGRIKISLSMAAGLIEPTGGKNDPGGNEDVLTKPKPKKS